MMLVSFRARCGPFGRGTPAGIGSRQKHVPFGASCSLSTKTRRLRTYQRRTAFSPVVSTPDARNTKNITKNRQSQRHEYECRRHQAGQQNKRQKSQNDVLYEPFAPSRSLSVRRAYSLGRAESSFAFATPFSNTIETEWSAVIALNQI